MAVVSMNLRRLCGILPLPSGCLTARRWRWKDRCKLMAQLVVVFSLMHFAWMLFAGPETIMAGLIGGPDRERRVLDGGIKLDFDSPIVGPTTRFRNRYDPTKCNDSTCHNKNNSPDDGIPRGEINFTDLDLAGVSLNDGRLSKEVHVSDRLTARGGKYPQWCAGQSYNTAGVLQSAGTGRQNTAEPKHFLTAVLLVRIYAYDLAKLTTREMMQWLQYLSYAGVEHVYVYDAYLYRNESQKEQLRCFIENGFVTYVDWSHRAKPKYTIAGTQVAAYQDCLNKFGREFAWQTAIDIDEYPFCSGDRAPGFLSRVVRELTASRSNVGEISMQNYLYLGKPLNDSEHPLLIDRLWRRTIKRANPLVKPIYQPRGVSRANVHHNSLSSGYVNYSPSEQKLRMGHYWGARLQGWGEDTPNVLNMTMEDRGMERAVSALKPCLKGCQMGCC